MTRTLIVVLLYFGTNLLPIANGIAQSQIDSMHQARKALEKIDSLLVKTIRSDSILTAVPKTLDKKIDGLAKFPKQLTNPTDSLKPDLSHYNRKLDSIKGKLTHTIDSLNRLKLPTAQYTHLLDSIQRAGPLKDIKQAETSLVSLERRINQPVAKLNAEVGRYETKINEKLNLVKNEAGAANLPVNTTLSSTQVPGLTTGKLPNTDLHIPTVSLPGVNPLDQGNGLNTNMPGASELGKPNGAAVGRTGQK